MEEKVVCEWSMSTLHDGEKQTITADDCAANRETWQEIAEETDDADEKRSALAHANGNDKEQAEDIIARECAGMPGIISKVFHE